MKPDVSPDGSRVAFSRCASWPTSINTACDIYLVNRDGTGLTRLTTDGKFNTEPRFSPDGRRIAYISARSGNRDIWVMDVPGGSPRSFVPWLDGFSFTNTYPPFDRAREQQLTIDDVIAEIGSRWPALGNPLVFWLAYAFARAAHNGKYGGHCYGMSALAVAYFEGVVQLPAGVSHPSELSLESTYTLIEFYQNEAVLDLNVLAKVLSLYFDWLNQTAELQQVRSALDEGRPTIIGLAGSGVLHAVVAYDYEDTGSVLYIDAYDPNLGGVPATIAVTQTPDGPEVYYDNGYAFNRMASLGSPSRPVLDAFLARLGDFLMVFVQSPVDLHIVDSYGRHVGPRSDGRVELGFDAFYYADQEFHVAAIPGPDASYRVILNGTGDGEFHLSAIRGLGGEVYVANVTGSISRGESLVYALEMTDGGIRATPVRDAIARDYLTWTLLGVAGTTSFGVALLWWKRRRRGRSKGPARLAPSPGPLQISPPSGEGETYEDDTRIY